MNPAELSKSPLFNKNSVEVSIVPGLQKEEQDAVEKRRGRVLEALRKLSAQEAWSLPGAPAPVIAVLGSGGGLRAHIACLGVLSELKRLGLLDTVTYLSGVSGSTWALSSFYTKDGNTEAVEAELKQRFDQKQWDLENSLEKTIEAAKLENYSLTDFWAYMVVSKQTRELQDSYLSSMTKLVEEGTLPYPIFAAIDGDLHHERGCVKENAQNTWFEFTPHHAGYPALGAYVPTTHFGSKFEKGRLVKSEPERDLSFLKGLWGSALASLEEIRHFILDQFSKLKERLKLKHVLLRGESFYQESPGVAGKMDSTEAIVEALLDLLMTYVEDPNAPSLLEKLQDLQQILQAGEGDEVGESERSWLAEMVQNWSQASPEERGKLLEQLIQSFAKQEGHSDSTLPYRFMKEEEYSGLKLPHLKLFFSELYDIYNAVLKTGVCCSKWEWGTIHNFLYKHDDIKGKMRDRKLLHLVDAGFAINTPYPLVLFPTRNVRLILSFDFSAGDPFEPPVFRVTLKLVDTMDIAPQTIRSTAKYCQDHNISFPPVEDAKLKEWSRDPASCYILKGKDGPVVMHFPLFNRDSCGDDIQKWIDTYGTIKMADSYTLELVTQLLELSKGNVGKNKERILSEIRKVARRVILGAGHCALPLSVASIHSVTHSMIMYWKPAVRLPAGHHPGSCRLSSKQVRLLLSWVEP